MGTFLWLMLLFPGVCDLSSSVPRQFHGVKVKKTWTEAQQYCREKFTDLATIDDMTEMEKLTTVIQEGVAPAWIGLSYGSSLKWQWSLADRDFYGENGAEFRNWAPGQPGGPAVVDCGIIGIGGWWYNYDRKTRYPFICYDGRSATNPNVLVEDGKIWEDAQRYCREHYTDLASVRNQAENDQIEAVRAPGGREAWIGLFPTAWKWSDGSSSSFRHWAPREPSGNEKCVEVLASGRWNDKPCSTRLNVICYEDLPTIEVVSPQSPFYPGDTVTMRCVKPPDTDWLFSWLKDSREVPGKTSQTITITLPEEEGQYQCSIKIEDSSGTAYVSKFVSITFYDLPAATLDVVSPPGPHFSGDVVTLKCNVTQFEDWHQYVWLQDNSTVTGEISQIITITLPQGAGHYQCYRQREDGSKTSSHSSLVNIMNNDNLVLVPENKTWMEARQYCRQHHVDLVSVSSGEIQRWVEGWTKGASSPHVWLGLRYECSFGFWFWVSGYSVCYSNWAPNAESELCYETSGGAVGRDGGKWLSLGENEELNFICTTKE